VDGDDTDDEDPSHKIYARVQAFSIVGINEKAQSLVRGANKLALRTTLVNGDPTENILKADAKHTEVAAQRNKSRAAPQTFMSLESMLVSEVRLYILHDL
jgi:hypothetical protein